VTSFDPSAPALAGGIYGLPHTPDDARVVLLPVPWEPTTSYRRGTARGPRAILDASRQVDLFDVQTGRPYEAGIAMLDEDADIVAWNAEASAEATPVIDAGGVIAGVPALEAGLARVNALSELLNARVEEHARRWIARGKLVGLVGGDHASPFGSIAPTRPLAWPRRLAPRRSRRPPRRVRGLPLLHASIMRNVATRLPEVARIVQVGIRDLSEDEHAFLGASAGRVGALFDAEIGRRQMEGEPFAKIAREAVARLPRHVYLSFDIDGLDPRSARTRARPCLGALVQGGRVSPRLRRGERAIHRWLRPLRGRTRSGRGRVGWQRRRAAALQDDGFALRSQR